MEVFQKEARVAFLGDSITAANNYTARIVDYYHKKLPELQVKFYNNGVSGGSVMSTAMFLEADLAPFKPTHVTIMLGVNDSNRNLLANPSSPERDSKLDEAFENYKTRMENLCDDLDRREIKVILCTPAPYAEFFITEQKPLPGGHALLLRYAEFIRETARKRAYPLVDFHARLSELYLDEDLYNPDHVHPNDLGHARMAECLLAAQGLPVRPLIMGEPPEAISPELDEWRTLVAKLRVIYAVEWMIVKNFGLPTNEKLAFVEDYVANEKWGDFMYFKTVSQAYLRDKPNESEITARIYEIMENLYN